MTNQQISKALKDKGFDAAIQDNYVVIYAFQNRQVTSAEIADALDIDSEFCQRHGSSVIIYGVDA